MPRKLKKTVIRCQFFVWKLGLRGGVYQADGRSGNYANLGRHSLGTRNRAEALEALKQLDACMAVEHGLGDKDVLVESNAGGLSLDAGLKVYKEKVTAPETAGGAGAGTWKRYRAVFDKFLPFVRSQGVSDWRQVTKRLLRAYAAWLDDKGYAERTLYLELTTIKQVNKHLVGEGYIPANCRITMPLTKPGDSPTYCYDSEEVGAITRFCGESEQLVWLRPVFIALACTGLRIGELSALRWPDIDFERNVINVTNDPSTRKGQGKRRRTKSRRGRCFPIHPDLGRALAELPRHEDGRVFHGPLGGVLKPDTVRTNLVEKILPAVAKEMREGGVETEIERGRLHSFRHYFASASADANVPQRLAMAWLGHQDSKMVQYYYHQADRRAQQEMKRLRLIAEEPSADGERDDPPDTSADVENQKKQEQAGEAAAWSSVGPHKP